MKGLLKIFLSLTLYVVPMLVVGADMPVSIVVDAASVPNENASKILISKLETALTDAGIHSESGCGLFLVAKMSCLSEQTVEGGMRKIKAKKYELTLSMVQPIMEHQFGSYSMTLDGAGTDDTKALTDAIRKINPAGSGLFKFITTISNKALDYYSTNLKNILSKAKTLSNNHEYDAAIALLWALPYSEQASPEIHRTLNEIYGKMQREQCSQLLHKARTAFSLKQYEEASQWLAAIDAESECGGEAKALIAKMGNEIRTEEKEQQRRQDAAEKRREQIAERDRARATDLEKHRISSMASVARAYYKSRARTVYYVI